MEMVGPDINSVTYVLEIKRTRTITGDDLESIITNVEALKTVYRPASGIYSITIDPKFCRKFPRRAPRRRISVMKAYSIFLAPVSLECD
jgi:hypothetical protein